MKVRDIMRPIISVDSAGTAYDASQLMVKYYSGCILVENNKTVLGIITESDFMRVVTKEQVSPSEINVNQLMSQPLKSIGPDATIEEAAIVMKTENIRRLPVLERDRFIGLVDASDVLDVAFGRGRRQEGGELQERRSEDIIFKAQHSHHLIAEVTKRS